MLEIALEGDSETFTFGSMQLFDATQLRGPTDLKVCIFHNQKMHIYLIDVGFLNAWKV